jgi:ankyrin repeat protein
MPWQPINVPAALLGALLILLTCFSSTARAQDLADCTAIGGGYDNHGVFTNDDTPAPPGANDTLKNDIRKTDRNSAYADMWGGADPQILINTWPHVGMLLFRSMLLMKAVANNNSGQVRQLLRQGADPNLDAQDSIMTPLITAASCASPDITTMLIQAGAKVNQGSYYEFGGDEETTNSTPIRWAAERGNLEIVQALLHAGANPNAQEIDFTLNSNVTYRDITPLLGDPVLPVLAALLKAGADPNLDTSDRFTPLIAAASNGDYEGCYLLLKAGADKRRKDSDGDTAAAAARKSGYPDLADAIENWTPKTPKSSWPHRHGKAQ